MNSRSTRRRYISPVEAAAKLEDMKDVVEDTHNLISELLNDFQISPLAAPSVIQARRLVKHCLEHLSLSVEILEKEV